DGAVGADDDLEDDRAGLTLRARLLGVGRDAVRLVRRRRGGILGRRDRTEVAAGDASGAAAFEPRRIAVSRVAADRDALVLARVPLGRVLLWHSPWRAPPPW